MTEWPKRGALDLRTGVVALVSLVFQSDRRRGGFASRTHHDAIAVSQGRSHFFGRSPHNLSPERDRERETPSVWQLLQFRAVITPPPARATKYARTVNNKAFLLTLKHRRLICGCWYFRTVTIKGTGS